MEGVQKNFAERVAEVRAKLVSGTPVEVWIQDEIGLVRRTNSPIAWPERAHVRAPATNQRTQSTYLFGAVCPQNAEPVSPSRCLQLHLDEIATKVTPRRPRHSHSRLSRLTWRKRTCASQAASRSCRCRRGTPRAQQPGKHLAVHASEPAVEPHLQIFSTTSSITAATPGTP